MFNFLLVVQALVTLTLIVVILMQRSEGGGLGIGGGSPSGLMSARGAADFLTRATTVLASLFVILSIILAGLASTNRTSGDIDTSLARTPQQQSAPEAPVGGPLGGAIPMEGGAATAPAADAAGQDAAPKADDKAADKGAAPASKDQSNIPLQQ